MQIVYKAHNCLALAIQLQQQATRWGKEFAVGELMRMAVQADPSEATVFALCRMLFVSRTPIPLRPPSLGEPWWLGETTAEDWPLEPIHLYKGLPFFVVKGWSLAGLSESPNMYLACCLLNGVWNDHPYPWVEEAEITCLASAFIETGPWRAPLPAWEQKFLRSQI
jgi:hypothetical protein